MSGIENIKSRILEEANHSAQQKIDEAHNRAKSILDGAQQKAQEQEEKYMADVSRRISAMKERAASASDMERRQQLLVAKRLLIDEVLEEAYTRLLQEGSESYAALLLRLVEKYALAKEGEICFSESDMPIVTEAFREAVAEAAKKKGGSLTVGKPRAVEKGFVLVYGGVEENCTIKALFDARRDELADQVNRILFSADA